jgi:hypothetical protein
MYEIQIEWASWILIVLAHWNNSLRVDELPYSNTLSWFLTNQSLLTITPGHTILLLFICLFLVVLLVTGQIGPRSNRIILWSCESTHCMRTILCQWWTILYISLNMKFLFKYVDRKHAFLYFKFVYEPTAWASACYLMVNEKFFSYIMVRTSFFSIRWWYL